MAENTRPLKFVWQETVLFDSRVTSTARLLIAPLMHYAASDGTRIFPSIETLAMLMAKSPATAKRALRELETLGYLVTVRRSDGKGGLKAFRHMTLPDGTYNRKLTHEPLGEETESSFRGTKSSLVNDQKLTHEPVTNHIEQTIEAKHQHDVQRLDDLSKTPPPSPSPECCPLHKDDDLPSDTCQGCVDDETGVIAEFLQGVTDNPVRRLPVRKMIEAVGPGRIEKWMQAGRIGDDRFGPNGEWLMAQVSAASNPPGYLVSVLPDVIDAHIYHGPDEDAPEAFWVSPDGQFVSQAQAVDQPDGSVPVILDAGQRAEVFRTRLTPEKQMARMLQLAHFTS